MIDVSGRNLNQLARKVANYWEKGAMAPIFYDSYLKRSAKMSQEELDSFSGEEVKIPKSLNDLLAGDFEPRYEFMFTKPPVIDGIQFFTETSKKGVYVDAGYENGDSRFPCDVQLSDKIVHALLAGATGMGKSVFLDSVLYGILTRYPPWEVKLTLLDSKIVTFKPLAGMGFPHIETVAATSDNDYLLSVLEAKVEEMIQMNQVFEKSMTSAQKLEDLREATGLCFPRNIIIFDEFQACLSQAGRNASKITNMLDLFGRLGRSTGYHLILSSQEVGGALPKGLLNQIKLRMALGCSASVSETILGNDAARNLKTKGKMYLNTEPTEPNNESLNREFRVPFLEPNKMKPKLQKDIKHACDDYDYSVSLNFYNETAVVYEDKYPEFIRTFPRKRDVIYLGEPCRFTNSAEKIVKVEWQNKSMDNLVAISPVEKGRLRFIKMIKENLITNQTAEHAVFYNDVALFNTSGLSNIAKTKVMIRDTSNEHYKAHTLNIFYRSLLLDVDANLGTGVTSDSESEELYQKIIRTTPSLESTTNRARCFYLKKFLKQDSYKTVFGYKSAVKDQLNQQVRQHAWTALMYADRFGCKEKLIDVNSLPTKYLWLIDVDKVSGIGRDTKTSIQDNLKKVCQDAPLVNVHVIVVTSTCSDMSFLKECSNYVLLEQPRSRDISLIGASDTYPAEVSGVLAVLYDKNEDECFKFKKMFLRGELLIT